jgi:hypothetical protein
VLANLSVQVKPHDLMTTLKKTDEMPVLTAENIQEIPFNKPVTLFWTDDV